MSGHVSTVVLRDDGTSSREPNAICDACGRRGTTARARLETDPPLVFRWCRRCAPKEVARFEREQKEASRRWFDKRREAFIANPRVTPSAGVAAPPASSIKWDSWRMRARFFRVVARGMWRKLVRREDHLRLGSWSGPRRDS